MASDMSFHSVSPAKMLNYQVRRSCKIPTTVGNRSPLLHHSLKSMAWSCDMSFHSVSPAKMLNYQVRRSCRNPTTEGNRSPASSFIEVHGLILRYVVSFCLSGENVELCGTAKFSGACT